MSQRISIEERFVRPFYEVTKALQMGEIPLLVMPTGEQLGFVNQLSSAVGGTVVYTTQVDFVEQLLDSMVRSDYFLAIADQPIAGRSYHLVRAYLAARDIEEADSSLLANEFRADAPHPQHRLILIMDRGVLNRHGSHERQELMKICTMIAAS